MLDIKKITEVLSKGTENVDSRLREVLHEQRRTNELLEEILKNLSERG